MPIIMKLIIYRWRINILILLHTVHIKWISMEIIIEWWNCAQLHRKSYVHKTQYNIKTVSTSFAIKYGNLISVSRFFTYKHKKWNYRYVKYIEEQSMRIPYFFSYVFSVDFDHYLCCCCCVSWFCIKFLMHISSSFNKVLFFCTLQTQIYATHNIKHLWYWHPFHAPVTLIQFIFEIFLHIIQWYYSMHTHNKYQSFLTFLLV